MQKQNSTITPIYKIDDSVLGHTEDHFARFAIIIDREDNVVVEAREHEIGSWRVEHGSDIITNHIVAFWTDCDRGDRYYADVARIERIVEDLKPCLHRIVEGRTIEDLYGDGRQYVVLSDDAIAARVEIEARFKNGIHDSWFSDEEPPADEE